jgi:hypothetical protein
VQGAARAPTWCPNTVPAAPAVLWSLGRSKGLLEPPLSAPRALQGAAQALAWCKPPAPLLLSATASARLALHASRAPPSFCDGLCTPRAARLPRRSFFLRRPLHALRCTPPAPLLLSATASARLALHASRAAPSFCDGLCTPSAARLPRRPFFLRRPLHALRCTPPAPLLLSATASARLALHASVRTEHHFDHVRRAGEERGSYLLCH